MARSHPPQPVELLTISEAADLLGVSLPTLRRWDEAGKFTARRHPMNGYRIYKRSEVLRLRKHIEGGATTGRDGKDRVAAG